MRTVWRPRIQRWSVARRAVPSSRRQTLRKWKLTPVIASCISSKGSRLRKFRDVSCAGSAISRATLTVGRRGQSAFDPGSRPTDQRSRVSASVNRAPRAFTGASFVGNPHSRSRRDPTHRSRSGGRSDFDPMSHGPRSPRDRYRTQTGRNLASAGASLPVARVVPQLGPRRDRGGAVRISNRGLGSIGKPSGWAAVPSSRSSNDPPGSRGALEVPGSTSTTLGSLLPPRPGARCSRKRLSAAPSRDSIARCGPA